MLYSDLFGPLEKARWSLTELPWGAFEPSKLTDEQARTIKMNAITEWSALPAVSMFLRDNAGDPDFSAFMSVWFYEEQKHALVLMEYLRRFRPDLAPTESELGAVSFEFEPADRFETLMLHFCGEMRLCQWYLRAAEWHTEPVIQHIYRTIAADEQRHAGVYFRYMQRAIQRDGDTARLAFAKIASLMVKRHGKAALHPTALHVNRQLFPLDTVQSRLPDPQWLERWLDSQLRFDDACEQRVAAKIMRRLAQLFDTPIDSVAQLRAYRKSLAGAEKNAQAGSIATHSVSSSILSFPKGSAMNALSDVVNFSILNKTFRQIQLEFDASNGALWVKMRPAGRPCFSLEFMEEVRACQIAIEQTGSKIFADGTLHNIQYVVLSSALENVFNLGGDLELFRKAVVGQDRVGLLDYAKRCVDISYQNYCNYNLPLTTIALVQGEALGGGFESALSAAVLIAEKSAKFALPEIHFNLFPGMGAYTYLGRKVGIKAAEELILSGKTYTGEELYGLGVVDVLADDGRGVDAFQEYARKWAKKRSAVVATQQARARFQNVTYQELYDITVHWVDAAMKISGTDLKMMGRLVRAQQDRYPQARGDHSGQRFVA
jgi:enoyl-CoA hydratase/carnithine racemase